MEKKKTKLTISGSSKKTIKSIEQAKTQSKNSTIIEKDVFSINPAQHNLSKFDLIFLDPPFKDNKLNQLIGIIKKMKITYKNTLIIIHRNTKITENISKDLIISKEKNYGLSKIIFGKIC